MTRALALALLMVLSGCDEEPEVQVRERITVALTVMPDRASLDAEQRRHPQAGEGRSNGFALAAIIISAVLMVIGAILAAIFIPIFIESINAATVCANDPNATVEVFGQQLSCQQLLEQSGR